MSRSLPAGWVRCTPSHLQTFRIQTYPWKVEPDIFNPASTALSIEGVGLKHVFLWCYLRRSVGTGKSIYDPSSLSKTRSDSIAVVLSKLSKWLRTSRPRTVHGALTNFGRFLNWVDHPEHSARFENVLGDPDLALQALKSYHTYLRNRLQNHQISAWTAAQHDRTAIAILSEIHGRQYFDEIEPLVKRSGRGTEAPAQAEVEKMAQMLQTVFDSAARWVLAPDENGQRVFKLDRDVVLDDRYSLVKVAELACVSYAGLVFIDSGANLAVLQSFEEPDDLEDQLVQPDRINLTQKAVKFRAGGKIIEVHLSATTVTRIRTYLKVRQVLVDSIENTGDVKQMLIQGVWLHGDGKYADPRGIRPLDSKFLKTLRGRIAALGSRTQPVSLPKVTLRQLRVYKQQDLVRRAPLPVAAKLMGHSVETALKAYCKAQESTRSDEMNQYFASLGKTVVSPSPTTITIQPIPAGGCADHGKPVASIVSSQSAMTPDCTKAHGCFFCDNYRVHADEQDIKKLMSCRKVLAPLAGLARDSLAAVRVYQAVVDRIDALLVELRRSAPAAFEKARVEVEEKGNLTEYFRRKIGQLALLGMLPTSQGQARSAAASQPKGDAA